MTKRKYLTTAEVAAIRRMKEASLAQERNRMKHHGGDGPPYVKDGGRVLYPRDALYEWLDARTVESDTLASRVVPQHDRFLRACSTESEADE
jgi:hypothetical protein